jgi:hypothetical protein
MEEEINEIELHKRQCLINRDFTLAFKIKLSIMDIENLKHTVTKEKHTLEKY